VVRQSRLTCVLGFVFLRSFATSAALTLPLFSSDGLWLNESFAKYVPHLVLAEATEFGNLAWIAFAGQTKKWAFEEDESVSTHPIFCSCENTDQATANFDGLPRFFCLCSFVPDSSIPPPTRTNNVFVSLRISSLHPTGITYAKGASMLKQLYHVIGREAFKQGLRYYFKKHEVSV